jgi:potassium-transporting ATPase KdpC subunit
MRKDITTSVIAIVAFTVVLGVGYPLAVTGISQVAFPNKSDGSQLKRDGKVVGSTLIGQDFRKPVLGPNGKPKQDADGNDVLEPDPRYFQSRPSATGYTPDVTYFGNLGPNSKDLRDQIVENQKAYLALEGKYNPGLKAAGVPNDAVQTSASGVDPHISLANARIQAARIAAVRRLSKDRVLQLIDDNVDGRFAGVLGERGVNVLELNLALDRESR